MASSIYLEAFFKHINVDEDLEDILNLALNTSEEENLSGVALTAFKLINRNVDFDALEESTGNNGGFHDKLSGAVISEENKYLASLKSALDNDSATSDSNKKVQSLKELYMKFAKQFVRFIHVVNTAYRLFTPEDKDTALDYIHIYYLLKNFHVHEKVEYFQPLSDSIPLKAIYITVLNAITDLRTDDLTDHSLFPTMLRSNDLLEYQACMDYLSDLWMNLKDVNIAKKAQKLYQSHTDEKEETWNKLDKSIQQKYIKYIEIYYLSEKYDDEMMILGNFLSVYDTNGWIDSEDINYHLVTSNIEAITWDNITIFQQMDQDTKRRYLLEAAFITSLFKSDYDESTIFQLRINWEKRYNIKNTKQYNDILPYSEWSEKLKCRYKIGFTFIACMKAHRKSKDIDLLEGTISTVVSGMSKAIVDYNYLSISGSIGDVNMTELHIAAKNGDMESLELLLTDENIDLYPSTSFGFTPLHWACYKGHMNIANEILMRNFELNNIRDKSFHGQEDWTPLMWASLMGNKPLVKLLLDYAADMTVFDHRGSSVLHLATSLHRVDVIRLLAAYDEADITLIDPNGWSLIHHAVSRHGKKADDMTAYILKILYEWLDEDEYNKIFNQEDNQNQFNALYVAAYNGHAQQVDMLMKYAPNETIWGIKKNKEGQDMTLLYIAARKGHAKVVQELLECRPSTSSSSSSSGNSTNEENTNTDSIANPLTNSNSVNNSNKQNSPRNMYQDILSTSTKLTEDTSLVTPVEEEKAIRMNIRRSYELLSQESGLTASVIWALAMYDRIDEYHLSTYQSALLNNTDAVTMKEIYTTQFLSLQPYVVETLDTKLKVQKNEYIIGPRNFYKRHFNMNNKNKFKDKNRDISYRFEYRYNQYDLTRFSTEPMKVSVYSFTIPHTSSLIFLERFILKLYTYVDLDVFDLEFVRVSIQSAWERYGLRVHIFETILYITYLGLFSVTNALFNRNMTSPNTLPEYTNLYMLLILIMTGYTLLLNIILVLKIFDPARELDTSYFTAYLSTYHTYTEIMSYALTYGGSYYRIRYGLEDDISSYLMAFSTILIYSRILYYLRPFEATGPLVGMIEAIAWKIKYFLFILLVVLISFAQAMYLLSWKDDTSGDNFGKGAIALVRAFQYMGGGASYAPDGTFDSSIANVLVVLFALISTIILLNLLISIMSSAYAEIDIRAKAEWYRQTCKTLLIQPSWIRKLLCCPEHYPYFVYIKRDLDTISKDKNDTKEKKDEDSHTATSTTTTLSAQLFMDVDYVVWVYDPKENLSDLSDPVNPPLYFQSNTRKSYTKNKGKEDECCSCCGCYGCIHEKNTVYIQENKVLIRDSVPHYISEAKFSDDRFSLINPPETRKSLAIRASSSTSHQSNEMNKNYETYVRDEHYNRSSNSNINKSRYYPKNDLSRSRIDEEKEGVENV